MSIQYRSTVAEINLEALRFNISQVKKRIREPTAIIGIVKANAYGHGALRCTRVLEETGIKFFGVATVEEGIQLREGGIRGDIVVLGGIASPSLDVYLDYRLKPSLHHLEEIKQWGEFLKGKQKEYPAHLKLDTGMGRLGLLPSELEVLADLLRSYPEIKLQGILTHLARADEEDPAPTDRQFVLFERMRKILEAKGVTAPFHLANSSAIIDRNLSGHGWVRPGIMLYGAYPHPRQRSKIELKPAMTFKTSILRLKKMPTGSTLGYGGTFSTQRESLIAILPVGYADGYPRLLSNQGSVLVKGQRAPVVGRISMDLTLVDVTDVPAVRAGEEVVLIGSQGSENITAEEVADWAQTISYEIFCGISNRVPRVYLGV